VDVFMNHPVPQIDIGPGGANPADLYCGIVQGTTIIVKDQAGNEYGMCKFADNSIIAAWTLFQGASNNQALAQVLTTISASAH
jgi:putative hemolysin